MGSNQDAEREQTNDHRGLMLQWCSVPWVPGKNLLVCLVKTWTAKPIMMCQILLKKHSPALVDTLDVPLFAGFWKHVSSIQSATGCCPIKNSSLVFLICIKISSRCSRSMLGMFDGFPLFTLARKFVINYMKCFLSEFTKLHQIWSTSKLIPPPVVLLQVSFEYLAAAQMMVK